MLLANTFSEYIANFKTALVFVLLLVFAPIAFILGNFFIGSGTIFLDYNLSFANPAQLLLALAFAAVYVLIYSFFISIIIFSVRKDLSTLHFNYYLTEMIKKFTFKIFWFNLGFFLVLFLLGSVLFFFNVPALVIAAILFLLAVSVIFVPQAIVIDEENILNSIYNNFDFFRTNFSSFAKIFVTAIILLAIVQLIEFLVDLVVPVGAFVSIIISLIFIVPYLEVMKTYLYMLKYDLIRNPDVLHRKAMKKKHAYKR
ncbi:MAG: hypothetical protein PHH08_01920 [Candidatus ainarchaeum sp.]|nr:hypothetical protein [Candidatus ainarchaeum sp.]